MSKYKYGLASVSFREHTPKQILSAMREAELSFIEWGSDIHAPKDDTKKLCDIAALQNEYGIICSSYGTYFRLGDTTTEELEDYINAAKILGTDILRLWCGNKDSQEYSAKERDHLFKECIKTAQIAEKNGVKLCMECHNDTYTNTRESALELMRSVNSNRFRMYWQPNQFMSQEENLEYAAALSEFTEHIHVFNWDGKNRLPLKSGISIWKKYLEKFSGEKTLLLEFMPDNCIESLVAETEALKKITE